MKRICFLLVLVILVSTTGLTVYAKPSVSNGDTVFAVYDYEKIPEKSYCPKRISKDGFYLESPLTLYWYAMCKYHDPLFFDMWGEAQTDSYCDEEYSQRYAIDYIKAKVKLYVNGILDGSATDDDTNASHAGISLDYETQGSQDYEVYGLHACEEEGYESWYPETYDSN